LRILGDGVRREVPHPCASGGRCPLPGRSTGTRPCWSWPPPWPLRVPMVASSRP